MTTLPGLRLATRAAAAASVTAVAAGTGLAGCSNQVVAQQVPVQVTGVVTSKPPCVPGQACPFLVALVPGALVVATGKDGTHEVHADGHGRYGIYLLEGRWTLRASRPTSSALETPVSVDLQSGHNRQVSLQAAN
jgi:hypothetical protein